MNTKFNQTEIVEIPEDWSIDKLSEFVEVNPFRKLEKGKDSKSVPMEFLSPFTRQVKAFIAKKYNGGTKFKNGDTLLARITPCLENGKTAYVDFLEENEIAFGSTEYIVLSEKENVSDSKYIYYLAISPEFRKIAIKSMSGSSGRQRVQTDVLSSTLIAHPNIKEQKQIASILSSLDDKIELNQKTIKTLEDTGQALFKRWFVDFEFPNEKGEPYKSNGGEMVDSEIGKIPKGWSAGQLSDEFEVLMGQSPPGDTYNDFGEGLPFYQGRVDFGFRFPSKRIFCSEPSRVAKQSSTLISVRAPVGDINQAIDDCCIGRGVASIIKKDYPSYTYHKIKYLQPKFKVFDNEGTVFGSINKDSLSKIEIYLPTKEVLDLFEKIAYSLDQQILNLSKEIESVENTKTILLPKLLSGKIRV